MSNNYNIGFETSTIPAENNLLKCEENKSFETRRECEFESKNLLEEPALVAQEEDFESSVPNSPHSASSKQFLDHIEILEHKQEDKNLGDEVKLLDKNLGDEVRLLDNENLKNKVKLFEDEEVSTLF